MHGRRVSLLLLTASLLVSSLAATACDSATSTAATTPTPVTSTESFAGEIAQLASARHPFTVSAAGPVTVSVTSVAPLSTMAIGVSVGAWDATTLTCGTAAAKNDNARAGAVALSGTAASGNYCLTVYDSGNIPEGWSVAYAIDVIHP